MILFVLGLLAVAGASGLTVALAFTTTSNLKYLLSVAVPVAGIALLNLRRPDLVLAVLTVLVAPFSFLSVGVAGLQFTAVDVLLLATVVAVWLRRPVTETEKPLSSMTIAVSLLALTFAVPLLQASDALNVIHLLVIVVIFALVVSVVSRHHGPQPIVVAFVLAATVQSALALIEFNRGSPLNFYAASGTGAYGSDYFFAYGDVFRPAAAFPDPISLGNVLALACPLVVVAIRNAKTSWARFALAASGLVIGLALVATFSRQSWLAAVAGVLITIVLLPSRARIATLFGFVGVLAAVLFVAISVAGPDFLTRLQSIDDPTSATVSTSNGDEARIQLQRESLRIGLEHQPVGVGLGNLPEYLIATVPNATSSVHAHNTYLNVFAEAGIIGLAGVGGVLVVASAGVLRSARRFRDPTSPGLAGSIVALFIFWATDYTIRYIAVAAMVAVVFGLAAGSTTRRTVSGD